MEINVIDHTEWLNLINKEAHSDLDYYKFGRYQLGNSIMSVIESGVGVFRSPVIPATSSEEEILTNEEIIKTNYNSQKKENQGPINLLDLLTIK